MKISEPTLQALEQIITGNGGMSPRRSGLQLVNFFNRFGCNDEYGKGFPSRWQWEDADLALLLIGGPIH